MGKAEFLRDLDATKEQYSFLEYEYTDNGQFPHKVTIDFDVTDGDGTQWGTFSASIYFHYTYPKGFALVKDGSKEFPWEIDWHIDEKSGFCCVCGPIEREEKAISGISVTSFVKDYVIPFYANQVYKREFGQYKNGEYAHNDEGIWQALEDEFETTNRKQIAQYLKLSGIKRGRNEVCFCESGKKYKKCHLNRIGYIKAVAKQLSNNADLKL